MDENLLVRSISEILQIATHADLIFHGGEPLLAGKEFFHLAVNTEQENLPPKGTVSNFIQTNATLVDDEWVDLFQKKGFKVSVSLDGPSEVNDANRIYPDKGGTFRDAYEAVAMMVEKGLDIGALAVVTPQSVQKAQEIYRFFFESLFYGLDFLPCEAQTSGQQPKGMLSPESYASFMIEIFDQWKTSPYDAPRIRFFNELISSMFGERTTLCTLLTPKPCGHQVITIDNDGEVYICDDFVGNPEMSLGNIRESDLETLLTSSKSEEISSKINSLPSACSDCPWLENCHGGCVYHRHLSSPNLNKVGYFCQSNKRIFKHVYNWLSL
jgi:uncharacterized protein